MRRQRSSLVPQVRVDSTVLPDNLITHPATDTGALNVTEKEVHLFSSVTPTLIKIHESEGHSEVNLVTRGSTNINGRVERLPNFYFYFAKNN